MSPPSKWLFFPSPASSGGTLQTMTYDMTGPANATVTSSGQAIISLRAKQLTWTDGKMRFWNGEAAATADDFSGTSSSGTNTQWIFTSGTTCRVWWHNYAVSVTLNGGSPISMNATQDYGSGAGQDITGSLDGSCQTSYVNASIAVKGSALVSGDTLVFTITAAP